MKNEHTEKLELTEEQNIAYKQIEKTINQNSYKTFLLYGITGSRQNGNLFTINKKSIRTKQNSNYASSRNIFNTSNVR